MVYNCRLIALLLYYRPACTRKRLPLYNGITVGVVYTYAAYPGGKKQILKGKNEPDHFSITGDSIIQAGREQKILFTLDATLWGGTKRRLEL